MQKRKKKKSLPPPEIPGRKINRLSKTLFLFLHFFYFISLFFSLSPRKADFISKTIHICFWPRSQNFLFAQNRLYQG